MKKLICLLSVFAMIVVLFGCSKATTTRNNIVNTDNLTSESAEDNTSEEKEGVTRSGAGEGEYDVDLTKLNSTMVYSEVNHMLYAPEDYLGKKIKMSGTFNKMEANGRYYFSCLISDATACCSNGIEFILSEGGSDPDAYPKQGKFITVEGYFDTYTEAGYTYCQLVDAAII